MLKEPRTEASVLSNKALSTQRYTRPKFRCPLQQFGIRAWGRVLWDFPFGHPAHTLLLRKAFSRLCGGRQLDPRRAPPRRARSGDASPPAGRGRGGHIGSRRRGGHRAALSQGGPRATREAAERSRFGSGPSPLIVLR